MHANHNRIQSAGIIIDNQNENLTELYLVDNLIESVDFLDGLKRLEIVDLSYNSITNVNKTNLKGMLQLKKLILSHNQIKFIDLSFTEHTPELIYFDLSYNQLDGRFELKTIAEQLKELNISGNNFTSLDVNIRRKAPKLKLIDLNENSFNCSDLTTTILFLHFDHISSITKFDPAIASVRNVKGIRCNDGIINLDNLNTIGVSVDESNLNKSCKNSYNNVKKDISTMFEDKLKQLETKLMKLLNNAELKTIKENVAGSTNKP